jgi:1-pyrroline-5-carboxylate dehydrogenase
MLRKNVQSGLRSIVNFQQRSLSKHLKAFATLDPNHMSAKDQGYNLVNGEWTTASKTRELIDPMSGKPLITLPDTQMEDIEPFVSSLKSVPKSGVHNPFKNKERYLMLSEVNRKTVEVMHDPEVFEFFVRCVQRSVPKSHAQTTAEISVTVDFLENFCGDQVRFLAHSYKYPGDHDGQFSTAYRFPYGGVGVITPFNFPIEIPVLQFMGALFMGNKPFVKPDTRCSFVLEQWIRMLHYCGLPKEDMDFAHADGPVTEKILQKGKARTTLFTGSSRVGEHLVKALNGKVKLEDGGYDWKILGPDAPKNIQDVEAVAFQCDQDAYAHSGQKCSAQSVMFMHRNWKKTALLEKMRE